MITQPSDPTEALRASFRPDKIKTLLVGESAPAGGDFFYLGRGQVYREIKKALGLDLNEFREAGYYLDDLVLEPINWHTLSERKQMQQQAVPMLADRINAYKPQRIIAFMKGIEEPVKSAISLSGISCPFYAVSFPGNGQQVKFQREIAALLKS
ncbi:hypothetical protein [Tateyamaria sp.]|uniref:hypothetical protein n=1 Tax=Tateyamaria sp. TaxID=1929288 RepID=UPI0032A08FBC